MADIKKDIERTRKGPDRVVINEHGEAVPPRVAIRDYGIDPRDCTIFVREDGWSLAAPKRFREVAEELWRDEWVMAIDGDTGWR